MLNNALSTYSFEKDSRNVEFDKNRSADIMIWNIQRDLLAGS